MEKPKKKSKEFIITMLLLTLISGGSAAYVIYFRIKMKPYQIKYDEKSESSQDTPAENAPQNVGNE